MIMDGFIPSIYDVICGWKIPNALNLSGLLVKRLKSQNVASTNRQNIFTEK